jgi:hypothetical protein
LTANREIAPTGRRLRVERRPAAEPGEPWA